MLVLSHLSQEIALSSTGGNGLLLFVPCTGFICLTSLDLSRDSQSKSSRSLGDTDLEAVGKLGDLCHLNLDGNKLITEFGLGYLAKLQSLAFLNIGGCSWELSDELRGLRDRHLSTMNADYSGGFKSLVHVQARILLAGSADIPWPSPNEARRLLLPQRGVL